MERIFFWRKVVVFLRFSFIFQIPILNAYDYFDFKITIDHYIFVQCSYIAVYGTPPQTTMSIMRSIVCSLSSPLAVPFNV